MKNLLLMLTTICIVLATALLANHLCPPFQEEPDMIVCESPTQKVEPPVEEPIIETPTEVDPPVEDEEPEVIDISPYASEEELVMLAKLVYGEARGIKSDMEKAAVVWCVLNRVDTEGYACGKSIEYVVTFEGQFDGYLKKHPVIDEFYELSKDVVTRWVREKLGEIDVGRVLPTDYLWFLGDGKHNHFRNKYDHYDASNLWDWRLPTPYED